MNGQFNKWIWVVWLVLEWIGVVGVTAAPRISEFLASNRDGIKDQDGETSDWIEVINPDSVALNLEGYGLTDDIVQMKVWIFPNLILEPGERVVVFASGKNRAVAGEELHTNFSLNRGGEYLGLIDPGGQVVFQFGDRFPEQFADWSYGEGENGSVWIGEETPISYAVLTTDIGTEWRTLDFRDFDRLFTSRTPDSFVYFGLGYDTSGEYAPLIRTDIPPGSTGVAVRVSFQVDHPEEVSHLELEVQYDDAFVAWLNGVEVARSVGVVGEVSWNSVSSVNHEASLNQGEIFDLTAFRDRLLTGDNLMAFQVLNRSSASSDLVFLPKLVSRSEGISSGYMAVPSPGKSNGILSDPGPEFSDSNVPSVQPLPGQAWEVSIKVSPRLHALESVQLFYRFMYEAEEMMIPAWNGGNEYSVTLPGGSAGQMLRWRWVAQDVAGNESRWPPFVDRTGEDRSAEYFGTVVMDPSLREDLPVYHWFTADVTGARNRVGARGSFFYQGRFYDNIYVRQRGGFTNTGSQKFAFNNGDNFEYFPDLPKVGEINLNANGSDSSYLRQPIAFGAIALAGAPSSLAFPVQLRLNGRFDRVAIHIEQVDEDFLKRQDLPRDGALYKFVQRSNLRPVLNDTETGVEKKTRLSEDQSDLESLIRGLKQSLSGVNIENSGSLIHTPQETASRELFLFDHLNIPQVVNYLAAHVIIQETDDTRKNFYLYRDTEGSGEWYLFPWDKDFTFGVGESADGGAKHPFWGDAAHKNPNANQWNVLYDALHQNPRIRQMILRRTRSLMDRLYTVSPNSPMAYFENEARRLEELIDPVLNISRSSLMNEFNERRLSLYANPFGPSGSEPLIPLQQEDDKSLDWGTLEFSPESGNSSEDYIELINANDEALDVSAWKLQGNIDFHFPYGMVVPGGGSVFISPDVKAFRARSASPRAMEGRFVVGGYSGSLGLVGGRLELVDDSGRIRGILDYPGETLNDWLLRRGSPDPDSDGDGDGFTEVETYYFGVDLRPRLKVLSLEIIRGEIHVQFQHRDRTSGTLRLEKAAALDGWQVAVAGQDYTVTLNEVSPDGVRDVEIIVPGQEQLFFRLRVDP